MLPVPPLAAVQGARHRPQPRGVDAAVDEQHAAVAQRERLAGLAAQAQLGRRPEAAPAVAAQRVPVRPVGAGLRVAHPAHRQHPVAAERHHRDLPMLHALRGAVEHQTVFRPRAAAVRTDQHHGLRALGPCAVPTRPGGRRRQPAAVRQLHQGVADLERGAGQRRVDDLRLAPARPAVIGAHQDQVHRHHAQRGVVDDPLGGIVAPVQRAEADQAAAGGAQPDRVGVSVHIAVGQQRPLRLPGGAPVPRPGEVGAVVQGLHRRPHVVAAEQLAAAQVDQRRMKGVPGVQVGLGIGVDQTRVQDAHQPFLLPRLTAATAPAARRAAAPAPRRCSRTAAPGASGRRCRRAPSWRAGRRRCRPARRPSGRTSACRSPG